MEEDIEIDLGDYKVISFDADGTLIERNTTGKFLKASIEYWVEKFPRSFNIVSNMFNSSGRCESGLMRILRSMETGEIHKDTLEVLDYLKENFEGDLIITTNRPKPFLVKDLEEAFKGVPDEERSHEEYFSNLYSAMDYGSTKRDPEFYLKVCKDNNIRPEEMYHVGDNSYLDGLVPDSLGINTSLIDGSFLGRSWNQLGRVLEIS